MRIISIVPVFALLLAQGPTSASAQEVRNTSYSTFTGEKVLRIEAVLPVSAGEVWTAFTTVKGLSSWIAPVVSVDFKVGGIISTNYDKNAAIGAPGTIRLKIINYLEGEMITFKVDLNDNFPKSVRAGDENLQEIVQIRSIGNNQAKVVSSMIGWGQGKEWEHAFKFFAKGNEWTYKQLIKALAKDRKWRLGSNTGSRDE